jgi:predicted nucleotidyltransferase
MVKAKDGVIEILKKNQKTLQRFGVKRLGLFGSTARGTEKASSDLDFVVDLRKKSFDAYMGLKEFLEGLFDCRVDLVLTNTIKPRLRSRILKETVDVPGL